MHLFLFFENWKMALYAFQDVFCGKIKLSKGDWKQEISIVFWNLLLVSCLLCYAYNKSLANSDKKLLSPFTRLMCAKIFCPRIRSIM